MTKDKDTVVDGGQEAGLCRLHGAENTILELLLLNGKRVAHECSSYARPMAFADG
jgi:hypothetical protein